MEKLINQNRKVSTLCGKTANLIEICVLIIKQINKKNIVANNKIQNS